MTIEQVRDFLREICSQLNRQDVRTIAVDKKQLLEVFLTLCLAESMLYFERDGQSVKVSIALGPEEETTFNFIIQTY